MSFPDFLLLINTGLICLYIGSIGYFFYARQKHPDAFKALKSYPNVFKLHWENVQEGVMFFFGAHVTAVGLYLQEVPVQLMLLIGVSAYLDTRREAAMYIHKQQMQQPRSTYHEQSQARDERASGDFDFNERAWSGKEGHGQSSSERASDHGGEPDYASALRDAQAEAGKISDEKAEKFAKLWRKLAKENGLHQKTRLFRELVAMLLEERAKGFKGRADRSEPTEQEVRTARMLLPRA